MKPSKTPDLHVVAESKRPAPAQSEARNRSYSAAHRIMDADLSFSHLGTPGTRRSKAVDLIAAIIESEFER